MPETHPRIISINDSLNMTKKTPTYRPGEVIVEERWPFVKVLNFSSRNNYCNNCFQPLIHLWLCMDCRLVRYCSKNCQKVDWRNGHRVECKSKSFSQYCNTGPEEDAKLWLFRFYALIRAKPKKKDSLKVHGDTNICLNDMMKASTCLNKEEYSIDMCETMASKVKSEYPKSKWTTDDFLRLLCLKHTSGTEVYNEINHVIGWSIYIEQFAFGKSCKPTAIYVYQKRGLKGHVRAIAPIPENENPCLPSIQTNLRKTIRRKKLQLLPVGKCHCVVYRSAESGSGNKCGVDFNNLNEMIYEMNNFLTPSELTRTTWSRVQFLKRNILELLRKFCHEYDERITDLLNCAYTIAVDLGVNSKDQILKILERDRQGHLLITYGRDDTSVARHPSVDPIYRPLIPSKKKMTPYNPGDVIIEKSVPFVKVLDFSFRKKYCNHCFMPLNHRWLCLGCKLVSYCNKNCQKVDWRNGHRVECQSKSFSQYCNTGPEEDAKLWLFRFYALLNAKRKKEAPVVVYGNTTICFNDMMKVKMSLDSDDRRIGICETLARQVKGEFPNSDWTSDGFLRLLCLKTTYGTEVYNKTDDVIGWGLYIEQFAFGESCKPTAIYVYENNGLEGQVRAIGNIPAGRKPSLPSIQTNLRKAIRWRKLRLLPMSKCPCHVFQSAVRAGVDFDNLNEMIIEMDSYLNSFITTEKPTWSRVQDLKRNALLMLRKFCCEHDQRITDLLDCAYNIAVTLEVSSKDKDMEQLSNDRKSHLLTTYGKMERW